MMETQSTWGSSSTQGTTLGSTSTSFSLASSSACPPPPAPFSQEKKAPLLTGSAIQWCDPDLSKDEHIKQVLFKTTLCNYFKKGKCKKGISCSFAHGTVDARPRPDLTKTSMCSSWQIRRACKLGDACKFAHGPTDQRNRTMEMLEAARLAERPERFAWHVSMMSEPATTAESSESGDLPYSPYCQFDSDEEYVLSESYEGQGNFRIPSPAIPLPRACPEASSPQPVRRCAEVPVPVLPVRTHQPQRSAANYEAAPGTPPPMTGSMLEVPQVAWPIRANIPQRNSQAPVESPMAPGPLLRSPMINEVPRMVQPMANVNVPQRAPESAQNPVETAQVFLLENMCGLNNDQAHLLMVGLMAKDGHCRNHVMKAFQTLLEDAAPDHYED